MEDAERNEGRLVMLLVELTATGDAIWIRRPPVNDELLYCFVNNEEIIFQATFEGDSGDYDEKRDRDPARDVIHAFGGDYRNDKMLWLPGSVGLDELIAIFWRTPVSHEQFVALRKAARAHLLDDLDRFFPVTRKVGGDRSFASVRTHTRER